MARQKLKALDDDVALGLGDCYWHPRKPAPKLLFADIDLGYLQNIVRWLKKKLEINVANENAAWSYTGNPDSFGSMYAEQAADHLGRTNGLRRDQIEILERYILWREEHGYVFHAPRQQKPPRKTVSKSRMDRRLSAVERKHLNG